MYSVFVYDFLPVHIPVVNPEAQTAKELLVMASNSEEQKLWVQRLSKRIPKKGVIQQATTPGSSGERSTPSG